MTSVFNQLQNLVQDLSLNSSSTSKQDELLKFLRDNNLREPELILRAGNQRLKTATGDQRWDLHEQVFVAILDSRATGQYPGLASKYLKLMNIQFPRSLRVKKLYGMLTEQLGDFAEANKIYDEILSENPTFADVQKRQIAVLRAMGDSALAAQHLVEYLKVFSADDQGWLELAEIYQSMGKLDLAKFCLEELILLTPENYMYHLRYAEMLYSVASHRNPTSFDTARFHFSQALELKPSNTRALYGILLCLRARGSLSHDHERRLFKVVTNGLNVQYKNGAPTALARLLDLTINRMQSTEGDATGEQKNNSTSSPSPNLGSDMSEID